MESTKKKGKIRADKLLLLHGLASSRAKAQALIMEGLVFAAGKRIEKPGELVSPDREIRVLKKMPYVSRGGLKLDEALEVFKISVEGKVAADLGASSGGFTDCLLQKGAKKVYAVDVNIKQIDCRIRLDPRVHLLEKNARYLQKDDFEEMPELVTADLSFISLAKVFRAIGEILERGVLLALVKPQFEAGRHQVGKKGVVRDPKVQEEVLQKVTAEAEKWGFRLRGVMKSSFPGQEGNREFFAYWTRGGQSLDEAERLRLIREAVWDEKD